MVFALGFSWSAAPRCGRLRTFECILCAAVGAIARLLAWLARGLEGCGARRTEGSLGLTARRSASSLTRMFGGVPADYHNFAARSGVRRLLAVVAIGAMAPAVPALGHHGPDSMYPTPIITANFGPCSDGGMSLGPTDTFCRQQDAPVSLYRQSSISATGQSDVAQIWQAEYNPTDLQGTFVSPVYSGSEETDIIYQQGTSGLGPATVVGATWCDDAIGDVICDQHYVLFRYATPGNSVASHETGHAVGLTHPTEANPSSSGSDPAYGVMRNVITGVAQTLGAHNVQQINSTY